MHHLVPNIIDGVMLAFYIFLPIISIWVLYDAIKRGKGKFVALLWAVGCFFLIFIVLPIWLWKRPNFFAISEKFCPSCRNTFKGNPICCPHCGYMLKGEITELSTSDTQDPG